MKVDKIFSEKKIDKLDEAKIYLNKVVKSRGTNRAISDLKEHYSKTGEISEEKFNKVKEEQGKYIARLSGISVLAGSTSIGAKKGTIEGALKGAGIGSVLAVPAVVAGYNLGKTGRFGKTHAGFYLKKDKRENLKEADIHKVAAGDMTKKKFTKKWGK